MGLWDHRTMGQGDKGTRGPLSPTSLSIGARRSVGGCVSTDGMIDSGAVGLQSGAEGHSVAAAATGAYGCR